MYLQQLLRDGGLHWRWVSVPIYFVRLCLHYSLLLLVLLLLLSGWRLLVQNALLVLGRVVVIRYQF